MKTTSRRTPRRLAAGIAVGALALTACGSDSNDAEEPATTEAAAEESGDTRPPRTRPPLRAARSSTSLSAPAPSTRWSLR